MSSDAFLFLFVFTFFWSTIGCGIAFASKTSYELRLWENYSRRQKICLGVIYGPLYLLCTIIYILWTDTAKARVFFCSVCKKYFEMLE